MSLQSGGSGAGRRSSGDPFEEVKGDRAPSDVSRDPGDEWGVWPFGLFIVSALAFVGLTASWYWERRVVCRCWGGGFHRGDEEGGERVSWADSGDGVGRGRSHVVGSVVSREEMEI